MIGVDHAGIGLIDGMLQGATQVFRFVSGVLSDRFPRASGSSSSDTRSRPSPGAPGALGGFASALGLRLADGVGKGMKDAPARTRWWRIPRPKRRAAAPSGSTA